MAGKTQSSLSGPGAPSVVGPGGFAIGGVGTGTPNSPFKFFTPLTNSPSLPVPILGWDNDGDYQVPNDYNNALYMLNVAECTLGDSPELPPPTPPATDIILMGWQGYYASRARMLEYDDRSPFPVVTVVVPVMDWTLDADNQRSNDYNTAYEMLNLAEYGLGDNPEAINYGQGVITGWDTDADMQLSNAFDYSIRLDPDDRVIRIFIPTQEIDNDSEQQFSTEVNKASAQDSNDTTVRIFIPVTAYDNDADQQIASPLWVSNIASDQGQDTTNFVITPFLADQYEVNQFSTDNNVAYNQYEVGQDWTQFIVVQIFNPALVPQIEDIQIGMQSQTLDIFDDRSNLVIVPLQDLTLDADNQVQQLGYYKDHLADEAVEKITLNPAITQLTAYDTDAENQLSNAVNYSLMQEVDDRQVLVPIPPGSARDIILMGWKGYRIPTAAMTEPDRHEELQITPPPPAPTMSSHDIDQYWMISTQIMFQSDDQGNIESTNFIILVPFVNIVEGLGEAEDE